MTPGEEAGTSLALWRHLFDSLSFGLVVANAAGDVVLCNQEARRITRRDATWVSLDEQRTYTLKTPRGEVIDPGTGPLRQLIQTGRAVRSETLIFSHPNGDELRVEFDAQPLDLGGARLFTCVLRDVTARHERSLREAEFLSVVGHELRNPLTPLRGLLKLALKRHEESGALDVELLHKAQAQIERLTKLIDGLMDLSRIETGRFSFSKQHHDLGELLDDLIGQWSGRHGDTRFALTLPEEHITLEIDAAGIEQVVHNLLDNALKYSPAESTIVVELCRDGARAVLRVQDRGVGIAAEEGEQLFGRFVQGKNATHRPGSLGLGLYVCHKIVEEHQGSIRFESEVGRGTTVVVELPLR